MRLLTPLTAVVVSVTLAALALACGSSDDSTAAHAAAATNATNPGGASSFGGAAKAGAKPATDPTCVAPDMLFALDRSLTMHRMPDGTIPEDTLEGHKTSKWAQAISAIGRVTAPPNDQGLRFGLELWPKAADGCVTLAQKIEGITAVNEHCDGPEILVAPDLGTGGTIASSLDPETTPICVTTPTGSALLGAAAQLQASVVKGKRQFVVLVTDGADWDLTCPDPDPLATVDTLAAKGIDTVIVGFSAEDSLKTGTGADFLDDMACAGRTAKGFPQGCAQTSVGAWRATQHADHVFYSAGSADELYTALNGFAASVCCNCVK